MPECFFPPSFMPGLPIQVRDSGLSFKDDMPKSDVNKEYYTQNMEREVRGRFLAMVFYWIREPWWADPVIF